MKTATSKFVTSFDVCVVVGACACGAISGILGAKYTNEMNQKLREVSSFVISNTVQFAKILDLNETQKKHSSSSNFLINHNFI